MPETVRSLYCMLPGTVVDAGFMIPKRQGIVSCFFAAHLTPSPPAHATRTHEQVTIHVEEQPQHRETGSEGKRADFPALSAALDESMYPSEAPTAPLSCVTAEGSSNTGGGGGRGGGVGIGDEGGVSGGSFKRRPRPKSMVSKTLNVARLSFDPKRRTVHKRRSSHNRRGSLGSTISQSSGGSRSTAGPYPMPAAGSACSSPTNSRFSGQDGDGDGETMFGDEGAMSGGEMGVFEGLKWGGHVQFKMPGEAEVRFSSAVMIPARRLLVPRWCSVGWAVTTSAGSPLPPA